MTSLTAAGPARRKRRLDLTVPLFLSPTLLLLLVFVAYPFLRAIWLSFTDTSLLGGTLGFVGLDNFRSLFADPSFPTYLRNSVAWTVGGVGLQQGGAQHEGEGGVAGKGVRGHGGLLAWGRSATCRPAA